MNTVTLTRHAALKLATAAKHAIEVYKNTVKQEWESDYTKELAAYKTRPWYRFLQRKPINYNRWDFGLFSSSANIEAWRFVRKSLTVWDEELATAYAILAVYEVTSSDITMDIDRVHWMLEATKCNEEA